MLLFTLSPTKKNCPVCAFGLNTGMVYKTLKTVLFCLTIRELKNYYERKLVKFIVSYSEYAKRMNSRLYLPKRR